MIDPEEFLLWYYEAKDFVEDWRNEAIESYDLRAGRQWTREEIDYLEEHKRPALTFNRIGPVIEAVRGHHIANRQEAKYSPVEPTDQGVVDLANVVSDWADAQCQADHHISDALSDMAVCGMGWCEMRMDYSDDPAGRLITAERFSPLEAMWDPSASQQNLMDTRYRMRGKWMYKDVVEKRWPKFRETDLEGMFSVDFEPRPIIDVHPVRYRMNETHWIRRRTNEVFVVQCQYWEIESVKLSIDPETGDLVELSDKVAERVEKLGLPTLSHPVKRFYQVFAIGDLFLEHTPAPHPNMFTLMCMTGVRDEMKNLWYGLVRSMKDPQRWSNKFLSDIQDYVANNRRGGAFVEDDALVDPRKAEESWNDPTGMVIVNSGALAQGKIQERQPSAYPQGLDRLLNFAVNAIPDVTGVNLELMGLVDRNQPGVLEAQRKQAGLTILAPLFDSLSLFIKLHGKAKLYFMQRFLADGRLIRVSGAEPGSERFAQIFFTQDISKFDVTVDVAPTSADMKARVFATLVDVIPYLAKLGIPPPIDIFTYLPIPATLADKWKNTVAQQQQQAGQKPDPAIMKAQMDIEKAQMDLQLERERMQVERERLQMEREKLAMEAHIKGIENQGKLIEGQRQLAELDIKKAGVAGDAFKMLEQGAPPVIQAIEGALERFGDNLSGALMAFQQTQLQLAQAVRDSNLPKERQVAVVREGGRIVGARVIEG